MLLALAGACCFGHEYRHSTFLSTLAAIPRRRDVLLAKTALTAGFSAAAGPLSALAIGLVGQALLGGQLADGVAAWSGEPGRVLAEVVVLCMLYALAGLAVAGLLRSLPAALVVLLVLPFVVEPILMSVLVLVPALEPVSGAAPYLPFTAAGALVVTSELVEQTATAGVGLLGQVAGGLIFSGYVALLLALAAALFARRDA